MAGMVASNGTAQAGRILFLTKYGPQGASSRYRAYQYWEFLEESGYVCTAAPLFADEILVRKYGAHSSRSSVVGAAPSVFRALARRWLLVQTRAPGYDLIYLEGEALPYLPFGAERALFDAGTPVVV